MKLQLANCRSLLCCVRLSVPPSPPNTCSCLWIDRKGECFCLLSLEHLPPIGERRQRGIKAVQLQLPAPCRNMPMGSSSSFCIPEAALEQEQQPPWLCCCRSPVNGLSRGCHGFGESKLPSEGNNTGAPCTHHLP